MKARIAITISVMVLYWALFNLYIYELKLGPWDFHYTNLLYNYITAGMFIFIILDQKAGFVSGTHKQINAVGVMAVMVNYGLIILTRHGIIDKSVPMFITFNAGLLISTIIITIFGIKHKVL